MAELSHVWFDADADSFARSGPFQWDAQATGMALSGHDHWHIHARTLTGGLAEGVDVVELHNGALSVSVLPTRGMGLWKADYRGIPLAWNSPTRRPVHPRHVELAARNGLGWLDGFNELLCRCGLAHNGPPGIDPDARSPVESQLTLHGRIANLPAHAVRVTIDDDGPGTLSVTGVVDECTLFGPQLRLSSTISTRAGSNAVTVADQVTNLGSTTTELQLLYHVNFGPPFLGPGSTVHCPSRVVVPRDGRAAEGMDDFARCLGPTPGYAEQVYYYEPLADAQHESAALLRNAAGDRGVSLHFDPRELPCFAVWKCTQPEADGYVTGLEPATGFPNFKAFEREHERVVLLEPGATYTTRVRIEVHDTPRAVTRLQDRISALQIRTAPQIHPRPTLPWCPE